MQTHLDVTLYDSAGGVLRSTQERFEPQQIRRHWRRPAYAAYRVTLDPLPGATTRSEVHAHEGKHANHG